MEARRSSACALMVLLVIIISSSCSSGRGESEVRPSTLPSTTTSLVVRRGAPVGAPVIDGAVVLVSESVKDGIIDRPMVVMRPAAVAEGERLPVVVALHSRDVSPETFERAANWRGAVAADRFIAVFPRGSGNSWNAGPCCPPASAFGTDDIRYLDAVLDLIAAREDVDPDRVHLLGYSNGGAMAYSYGCVRSSRIRSMSAIAGSNLSGCTPAGPVSLLHQHGNPDFVVPFAGEPSETELDAGIRFPDVSASVAAWAGAVGCAPIPQISPSPGGVVRSQWQGCAGGPVALVVYPGNQHRWPTDPVDGLAEALEFFGIRE